MNGINTFDDLIAAVEKGTFEDIVHSGSDQLPHLLNGATGFFEAFPFDDQMKAMACMVGMILGTLHGEPTAAGERLGGVMITEEDRLRMFRTQALVVFRQSLIARGINPPLTLLISGVSAALAMEWGFKAHEKGWNLEQATSEFGQIFHDGTVPNLGKLPPPKPGETIGHRSGKVIQIGSGKRKKRPRAGKKDL